MAKRTDLLVAALAHAAAGRPVFPCRNRPGTDRHKTPLTENGFKNASVDADQIKRWWRRWPTALIGMPTGVISGIDVVDLDRKNGKDGLAALPDWRTLSAVVVTTGSGGAHLYFRASGIGCTTERIAPGVDTRGDGGYVIVPPSPGYAWLGDNWPSLGPVPEALRPAGRARALPAPPARSAELLALLELTIGQGLSSDPDDLPAPPDPDRTRQAVDLIPNHHLGWDDWNRIGMAIWAASGGSAWGFEAFDAFSRRSSKYDARVTRRRWEHYSKSPPSRIGAGTLFFEAEQAAPGWRSSSMTWAERQRRPAWKNLRRA